jgi:type I restriction enzyme S subunit
VKYRAYDEYQESGVEWLGEVPAHWAVIKANYIGRLFGSEAVPESMVLEEGGLPFLKVGSLSSGSLEVGSWDWYVDDSVSASYRPWSHYIEPPRKV